MIDTAAMIGSNIKRIRRSKFITKTHLAHKCNLSRSYIERLEKGQRIPSIPVLITIAEELYLSDWRDLLYEEKPSI